MRNHDGFSVQIQPVMKRLEMSGLRSVLDYAAEVCWLCPSFQRWRVLDFKLGLLYPQADVPEGQKRDRDGIIRC